MQLPTHLIALMESKQVNGKLIYQQLEEIIID